MAVRGYVLIEAEVEADVLAMQDLGVVGDVVAGQEGQDDHVGAVAGIHQAATRSRRRCVAAVLAASSPINALNRACVNAVEVQDADG